MEWIKKDWLYILFIVIILSLICGLLLIGRDVFKAQNYINELNQSNRLRDQYIDQLREYNKQLRSNFTGLSETNRATEANNRQLIENNKRLRNDYDKIMATEYRRQKELREAIKLLESARHK